MDRRKTNEFHIGQIDDPHHYANVYKEVTKHDPTKHGNKNEDYMGARGQQPSLYHKGKLVRRKQSQSIIWDQESVCHIHKNDPESKGWGEEVGITLSPPKRKRKTQKIMSQPVIDSGPNDRKSGVVVGPVRSGAQKAPTDF